MVVLSFPNRQGTTVFEELTHIEEQHGFHDPLLDSMKVPEVAEYLFEWFGDLSRARPAGYSSVEPLSFREIQAWSEVTGTQLRPWEAQVLCEMDQAFRSETVKQEKRING